MTVSETRMDRARYTEFMTLPIHENVSTLNLGYVNHIFEIEADGQLYRVSVHGKTTEILKVESAAMD